MEEIWQSFVGYPLEELEQSLEGIFPHLSLDLSQMVSQVAKGNFKQVLTELVMAVGGQLLDSADSIKRVFIMLLLLGILSALFLNFAGAFSSHQVSDAAFYFTYLSMVILLLQAFEEAFGITQGALEQMVLFLKLFIPAYLTTVGAVAGGMAAAGYYEIMLFLIYGIESIFVKFVLPFLCSYIMLCLINGIWEEERLSALTDLMKQGTGSLLKWSLSLVTGIGILQSMVLPVLGSLKITGLQKAVSALPGLGGLADSSVQMLLGTAVLLKNSMGVVLFLLLLCICAVPLCKILLIGCLLKGSAALLGILADKRMTGCISRIGDGVFLLLRLLMTSMAYFLILAAVIGVSSNRGF